VRPTTPAPRDHACTDASDWWISAESSRSGSINSSAWPHTAVTGVRRWWLTLPTSPRVEFMVGPVGAADTRCPSLGRGQIPGPPVALRHLHLLQSNAGRPASWLVVSVGSGVCEVAPCCLCRGASSKIATRIPGTSHRFDDDADDARLGPPRRRPAQPGYETALRGSSRARSVPAVYDGPYSGRARRLAAPALGEWAGCLGRFRRHLGQRPRGRKHLLIIGDADVDTSGTECHTASLDVDAAIAISSRGRRRGHRRCAQ
jgi:hypothetical protein